MFVTNWLEAVYLKQVAHPGLLVPRSKFYILDNKYPNFQSREPVRIRSRDDPTAGQSNIVVSSPRIKSQNQHIFFFLLSLMFSKVKATAFVGSETDRFL